MCGTCVHLPGHRRLGVHLPSRNLTLLADAVHLARELAQDVGQEHFGMPTLVRSTSAHYRQAASDITDSSISLSEAETNGERSSTGSRSSHLHDLSWRGRIDMSISRRFKHVEPLQIVATSEKKVMNQFCGYRYALHDIWKGDERICGHGYALMQSYTLGQRLTARRKFVKLRYSTSEERKVSSVPRRTKRDFRSS